MDSFPRTPWAECMLGWCWFSGFLLGKRVLENLCAAAVAPNWGWAPGKEMSGAHLTQPAPDIALLPAHDLACANCFFLLDSGSLVWTTAATIRGDAGSAAMHVSGFELGPLRWKEENEQKQRGLKVPDVYSFLQQTLFKPLICGVFR